MAQTTFVVTLLLVSALAVGASGEPVVAETCPCVEMSIPPDVRGVCADPEEGATGLCKVRPCEKPRANERFVCDGDGPEECTLHTREMYECIEPVVGRPDLCRCESQFYPFVVKMA